MDTLLNVFKPPLIYAESDVPYTYARLNVLQGNPVTLENYTAKAFILPDGIEYYRKHYENANWKAFQLKFDVLTRIRRLYITGDKATAKSADKEKAIFSPS